MGLLGLLNHILLSPTPTMAISCDFHLVVLQDFEGSQGHRFVHDPAVLLLGSASVFRVMQCHTLSLVQDTGTNGRAKLVMFENIELSLSVRHPAFWLKGVLNSHDGISPRVTFQDTDIAIEIIEALESTAILVNQQARETVWIPNPKLPPLRNPRCLPSLDACCLCASRYHISTITDDTHMIVSKCLHMTAHVYSYTPIKATGWKPLK